MLENQILQPGNSEKSAVIDSELSLQTYPIINNYLGQLFIWISIWAISALAFIWIIDPYGISPFKIKLAGINLQKPKRLDIDRLIKPLEVWRYQPKTIFIGTSRIQQSLDPSVFDGTKFAPAYNAAIPASTLGENGDNIEQFLKLNPKIKHIFVELFLYNFTGLTQDHSFTTWRQFISNIISLEISTDALLDAIKTLYINGKSRPTTAHIAERGYRVPNSDFNPATTFNDILFMRTVLAWNRDIKLHLQDSAFNALDRIVAIAQQHGIELHLFVTPNYPWDDYRLMTLGYWPLLEKWLRKIATYPNVVSFSQYNTFLEEPPTLEPRMKWWNDPIHFSLNMGRAMLKAYLGHPDKDTPKNIVRSLNSKTVESVIAERRAGILHWVTTHPDFVQDFEDAKAARDIISGELNILKKNLILNEENHPIVLGEGEVSFTKETNTSLVASGWTVDESTRRPARELVATVGTAVVAQGFPSVKRPDIELAFNKTALTSGFSIVIPNIKRSDSEPLRIFAIMQDGRAVQLPSEDKIIDSLPVAAPLGVVKAHELIINQKTYPILNLSAGSITKVTPLAQGYRIEGWLNNTKRASSVLAIVAATSSNITAKSLPTLLQETNPQNTSNKTKPMGFRMFVPSSANSMQDQPKLQVYALLSDGHASPFKANF